MAGVTKKRDFVTRSDNCWIVIIAIFTLLVMPLDGFNVDTVNFIKHSGSPGSMFGFSVAEHKERGKNWVLIGAPEAQTRQPGVTKGGSVFRCEVNRDDACEEILFDSTGNNNNSDGRQIDKKSNQWFGATVRSSGETGIVLACAPRYVWFSTTTAYRRDPVGTCYIAKNYFSEFSEYSPCRTRNWGYHRQGSCQAGLGADVSKDGNRLYVGAPGSWYWQGQIYDITSTFKMPTVSPDYSKINELNLIEYESGNKDGRKKSGALSNKNNQPGGGQLYAQNPNKKPEVLATSEGSPQDDDSYLGYSVAAGDFEGTGQGGVAVGMPRGAGLFGKVVLYSVNLTNLQNLTGHQLGSYFSYSLAAVDVDGDGLDDVIVGAPLHTDLNNNEGKYETGRVYIYYQQPRIDSSGYYTRFSRYDFRDGKNSKGRFGLSVAALGDTNKDGFGDFAVGAPYDGPDGRGAVYIYHGKRGGVRESHSQVIRAEDLSVPTTTFGFSIAGGLDMDDNQYPDMVVGAYESDTALFFRSRPVVRMTDARVSFNSRNKQISLEEENCTLRDYTKVPCLYLQACLKYDGVEVDRQLDVDIGVTLDSKKPKSPRMFFLNEEGRSIKNDTMRLNKGELLCKSYYVYVKPNIRDKLTPLEAELRYNVKDTAKSQVGLGRRYTRSLTPVLDTNEMNIQKDSLSIQKNCGPDNICIPDLQVTTKKSVSKYLLGSGERFSLDVQVENRGEDAFEAMYNLQVPPGMNYINIERLDSDRSIPVQCSAPSPLTNNTLKCDIGNPLPKEKLVHFKVLLQPFHREGMKSSYNFVSAVNSTNPEDEFTARDNVESFTIPIWVETDLILQGSSHPPDIHYNMSHYDGNIRNEMDIGPQVFHVYNIRNKGPSDIVEAQAIFLWPSYTLSDDHLLYLLEQPETSGNVKCEYVENVNEERIELDRKRKSFLDSAAFSAAQLSGRLGSGVGRGRGGAGGRWGAAAGAAAAGAAGAGRGGAWAGGSGRGGGAGAAWGAGSGSGRGGGAGSGGAAWGGGSGRGGGAGSGGAAWGGGSGRGGGAGSGGAAWGGGSGRGGGAGSGGAAWGGGSERGGGAGAAWEGVGGSGRGGGAGASWSGGSAGEGGGGSAHWGREEGRVAGGRAGASWGRGSGGVSAGEGGSVSGSHWESSHREGSWRGGGRWEGISWESMTEEERRQFEEEMKKAGAVDFESGDGSIVHRTRIHGQSSASGGRHEGGGSYRGGLTGSSSGGSGGSASGSFDSSTNVRMGSSRGGGSSGGGIVSGSSSGGRVISSGSGGTISGGDSSSRGGGGSISVSGNGRVGGVSGGETSWSEERSGSSTSFSTSGSKQEGSFKTEGGSSEGRRFEWETKTSEGGSSVETGGREQVRTQDERRLQQKPLVFNATGYSRARGKVEGASKNLSDSTSAVRKAYGQNEFRTVALDLTPGSGSTLGINIVNGAGTGDETIENEISKAAGTYSGETFVTGVRTEGSAKTREYEDAINRELERKRQEAEAAAAAAAAAASGLAVDTKKIIANATGYSEEGWTKEKADGYRKKIDQSETVSSQSGSIGSGQSGVITHEGGSRGFSTRVNTSRTYHTHGHASGGSYSYGGGSQSQDVSAFERENERRRLEAEAAAAAAAAAAGSAESARTTGGTRTYQIHGSLLGNGTRTYQILSNGTKVYETRYDGDGLSEGSRNFAYEDAMNREYERRRQEAEAAAAAAAAAASSASRGTTYHGGSHTAYDTRTGGSRTYEDDLRAHEEALRREYEVKRQEAEAVARELERIRLQSEAEGPGSHNQMLYETIESLRREYEKKRLEVEAAAAAAAAAAQARSSGSSSSSHQYATEYHYRTNSSWGPEGGPKIDASGKWYVNNNGTVHSGSLGYDAEYLRQLQAEHEKRLREEAQRRSGVQYFNTSYFSSGQRSHDSAVQGSIDPDLGYVRTREVDESGGLGVRYHRTRERPLTENLVEDDDDLTPGARYKKSYDRNKRHPMLLTRFPRQVDAGDADLKSSLNCGPTKCTKIRCTVGPLTRGQEAWVAFRGRVWVDTLKKIGYEREIMVSSLLASQVTKLPHIGEPHNAKVETYEVFSELMPQDVTVKPEVAPLWIIVLSACAGTLILMLLSFLLWKLGFFKRNRPTNAPEKQPLNRNGYQPGDEQL